MIKFNIQFKALCALIVLITTLSASFANTSKHQFHHPQAFAKALKQEKDPGAKVYQQFCANCHATDPLVPLNAPRFREKSDWQARLKQSSDLMFKHVNEGLNLMPARGGCFECTDDELKAAIQYLLPKK